MTTKQGHNRMSDVAAEADLLQVIFHDDDETPQEFVIELLHAVFKKPTGVAIKLADAVSDRGQALCGVFPRDPATEMLAEAQRRIRASGYPLLITTEAAAEAEETHTERCRLCGTLANTNRLSTRSGVTFVCDACMDEIARNLPGLTRNRQFDFACEALAWHFAGIPRDRLVATSRQFPGHMRADVQAAIDKLFSIQRIRFFGIQERHRYETLTFASLTSTGQAAHAIAPAQYHDVDIGEVEPVKCLDNGLWLCVAEELRYAVLLSAHREHGEEAGVRIEIAASAG